MLPRTDEMQPFQPALFERTLNALRPDNWEPWTGTPTLLTINRFQPMRDRNRMQPSDYILQPVSSSTSVPHRWLWLVFGLSSGLSVAIFLARVWYTDTWVYFFLNWNLFLAWTPFLLAVIMRELAQRRSLPLAPLLALFGAWLLFFPNAPYIISDLMHLAPRQGVPIWYDAMLIFSYAWNGLLVGFASLWLVQEVVTARFGAWVGWAVAMLSLLAAGFGVYLGRFQRWNSWDVLVDPIGLAREILYGLTHPWAYPKAIVVTLLFASFMAIAYSTVHLFAAARLQQIGRERTAL
jgi:uncharacterized membrane protein